MTPKPRLSEQTAQRDSPLAWQPRTAGVFKMKAIGRLDRFPRHTVVINSKLGIWN
jgi:hypothetical protein